MKTFASRPLLLLATAFILLVSACTPDDSENSSVLPSAPEALAVNDHSSAGVVKGILAGSTGVFKISIRNGNDSIYCLMTFDGETTTLLPIHDLSAWVTGTAFSGMFSGTLGGQTISMYYKCNADGSDPYASFTIPGHTVSVSLVKETSTMLIKGYEGTYKVEKVSDHSVLNTGIFNFIVYGNVVAGQRTDNGGTYALQGTVANGKLTIGSDVMDITDTSVSGILPKEDGEQVVVTGTRTL